MPATAEHTLAVNAAKLRRMVALSATFQQALGIDEETEAENAASALEKVYLKSYVGRVPRPIAVVSMGESFDWSVVSGGDAYHLRPSGSLFLYLAIDTDARYVEDRVSAEWTAWDFFSGVLEDVAALSCADDADSEFDESHLPITRISVVGWGENPREQWNSDGRYYEAGILMNWGDE
jgi:hypothetical protein